MPVMESLIELLKTTTFYNKIGRKNPSRKIIYYIPEISMFYSISSHIIDFLFFYLKLVMPYYYYYTSHISAVFNIDLIKYLSLTAI